MKIKNKRLALLLSSLFALIAVSQPANAGILDSIMGEGGLGLIINEIFGTPDIATPPEIAAALIKVALGFLSIIFTTIVMYGGFVWMTSGGNKEKVKKAKRLLINGAIGVIIVLTSFSITVFVIENAIKATN